MSCEREKGALCVCVKDSGGGGGVGTFAGSEESHTYAAFVYF